MRAAQPTDKIEPAAAHPRDVKPGTDALLRRRGAVTAAHDSGVGFFDTAPWYGRGFSERRLGVALSQFPRDTFHLQTKVVRAQATHTTTSFPGRSLRGCVCFQGRFIVAGQPNDRDSTGAAIVSEAGVRTHAS